MTEHHTQPSSLQEEIAAAAAAADAANADGPAAILPVPGADKALTPYEAACEAAAALRRAAETLKRTGEVIEAEHQVELEFGIAEGWRHLAATMSGGEEHRRPILPPKPVEDPQSGR